jgi:repressor LexA
VVKLPEGYGADGGARGGPAPANDPGPGVVAVPLMGKIAAGTPIEAIRNDGAHVDVPETLLGRGDFYALTVQGDSMIDAGIHSGDTVIIRRGDTAENGAIVVALVYDDRSLPPDRVQIQGQLASLIRMYR